MSGLPSYLPLQRQAVQTVGKPRTGDCMFSLAGWWRLSSLRPLWKSFSNGRKGCHHNVRLGAAPLHCHRMLKFSSVRLFSLHFFLNNFMLPERVSYYGPLLGVLSHSSPLSPSLSVQGNLGFSIREAGFTVRWVVKTEPEIPL